jgi:hypothetical protein
MSEYGGNHTLLAKRLIARSSWFRSLPFWPLKTNEKQVNVSWRKRFSVSVVVQTGNGFQFPARLAENGGNGFQFSKDNFNIPYII